MNWYLAIRRMTEPTAAWRDLLPAHFAWLKPMHDEGTIIMSGPSKDGSLGIYVMRATDASAATRAVQADPLLQSPGATVEVIDWQLHQIMASGSSTSQPHNRQPTYGDPPDELSRQRGSGRIARRSRSSRARGGGR
jgi:uncharacterized protein YciI